MTSDTFSRAPLRLVADVGGTHARFALTDDSGGLAAIRTLRCDDYAGLAQATRAYLADTGAQRVAAAAIAVATAVVDDQVTFTNRTEWSFSSRALAHELRFEHFRVINDFTALALSLPRLDRDGWVQVGAGMPEADAPRAVVGPGTGLGVSALFRNGERWHALESEGGHVSFSATDDEEIEIQRILVRRFGHVSAERVLSGPGMVNLYRACCELTGTRDDDPTPAEITARGLADDPLCRTVLAHFCAMLGTMAGNLALTIGARAGVYIGGGITPRLLPILEQSAFRARFEGHGRLSDYLANVPTYVVTAEYPALLGALAALES